MVKAICEEHCITEGSLKIVCDGIKALQRAVDFQYFISPNHIHFDLTTAIWAQVKSSPMQWKERYVLGH